MEYGDDRDQTNTDPEPLGENQINSGYQSGNLYQYVYRREHCVLFVWSNLDYIRWESGDNMCEGTSMNEQAASELRQYALMAANQFRFDHPHQEARSKQTYGRVKVSEWFILNHITERTR